MRAGAGARLWTLTAVLGLVLPVAGCGHGSLAAAGSPPDPVTRAEEPLDLALMEPGGLEQMGLERAVLVASGVGSPEELARWYPTLDAALDKVVQAAFLMDSGDAEFGATPLGTRLQIQLHRLILRRYVTGVYDVREALERGDFNCLSATALYVMAARRAGLMATAYAMQGHIMAMVFDAKGASYVEATLPSPALLETRAALMGRTESQLLIPPALRATAFDVGPDELASMFYWNRMVDGSSRRNFAALESGVRGYLLLGPARNAHRLMETEPGAVVAAFSNDCDREDSMERMLTRLQRLMSPERLGTRHPVLRDARVKCFLRRLGAVPLPQQCALARRLLDVEGGHPLVEDLRNRADVQSCL